MTIGANRNLAMSLLEFFNDIGDSVEGFKAINISEVQGFIFGSEASSREIE